ncbi:enoyl-CoA hydratase/isomerase family protein [Roseiterribacter gracilis]|uniref:enoyl-CoA hydratase/isomerase family protein n=1 Tax=Roseiterribacter gracilis TaxID=2812848 RepID=UPI003B43491C
MATLTLARPAQGNALNATLVDELIAQLAVLAADGPRALVLRGEGSGFCGGFDLADLDQQSDGDLLLRFVRIEQLLQAVQYFPAPTIALAQKFAWGAGADLFAACRFRVCDSATRFSFPGARFGLVLGTRRLRALVGVDAAFRLLQAPSPISAEVAAETGLASALVDCADWSAWLDRCLHRLPVIDATTQAQLAQRIHGDEQAQDLAALTISAARPGLQARLIDYRNAARTMKAE